MFTEPIYVRLTRKLGLETKILWLENESAGRRVEEDLFCSPSCYGEREATKWDTCRERRRGILVDRPSANE